MKILPVITLSVAAIFSTQVEATTVHKGKLATNVQLLSGDVVDDMIFFLIQQQDGNLVLYRRWRGIISGSYPTELIGEPIWATYKNGTRTIIQDDGNLVQYDDAYNPVWQSGTGGQPRGNYTLSVENGTGQVELKRPDGTVYWRSPAPPPVPTDPIKPTCPGGGSPNMYAVCSMPNFQSRYTYRFPACSEREARIYASQNNWSWGPCN